ncbi:hypothetical protein LUZ63_009010 [Rhynchospora breviuscula]|uniref:Uncharacterized protein n=1 Tax=Rhynchospora breviuscula TaxID=2022672 RepID=A0A9Q0CE77_9POAL|nr:hypothetical protein LUZ63_009010 [Rhynchospora breviuscula]
MAHSLVPPSISLPTTSTPPKRIPHLFPSDDGQRQHVYTKREIMYGLSTMAIGSLVAPDSAKAAKRRPAPPSTEEKKDPNLSALQAKLLASKKRKEAMKDTVAKLRENGKTIQ